MSNRKVNGARAPAPAAAPAPIDPPAPSPIPSAIAAAVKDAGGTVGPIVPAVELKEFTITIPIERLNSIVACMGGGPFNLVQEHISWLQTQCQAQVAAAQKKANDEAVGKQSQAH